MSVGQLFIITFIKYFDIDETSVFNNVVNKIIIVIKIFFMGEFKNKFFYKIYHSNALYHLSLGVNCCCLQWWCCNKNRGYTEFLERNPEGIRRAFSTFYCMCTRRSGCLLFILFILNVMRKVIIMVIIDVLDIFVPVFFSFVSFFLYNKKDSFSLFGEQRSIQGILLDSRFVKK